MATNPYYTHSTGKPTAQSRGISADVRAELDAIANGLDGVTSAIAAAQNYASAPAFDAATPYTNGFVVYSTVDKQLYRRNSAGTSATDPSADAANWTRVVTGLIDFPTILTSLTAQAGYNYIIGGAACAVVAPAAVDGAKFQVTPANGLTTNTINFGSATVRGPAKTTTGILTMNPAISVEFTYSLTLSLWVF